MQTGKELNKMNKRAFSIIELLIVIAIISILAGIAVPYYNDYIYDARLSTLQQNLATIRTTINQFKADNGRGPFLIQVASGSVLHESPWSTAPNTGSELIRGPIQIIDGDPIRRSNITYLSNWPALINPNTGAPIPPSEWVFVPGNTVAYGGGSDTEFDFNKDFAFSRAQQIDDPEDLGEINFNPRLDSVIYNFTGEPDSEYEDGRDNRKIIDYSDIRVTIDGATF